MFELFKSHRPRDAKPAKAAQEVQAETQAKDSAEDRKPEELGGPSGPEPTRYGDWERQGICYDF